MSVVMITTGSTPVTAIASSSVSFTSPAPIVGLSFQAMM